jgi:hypothetical protein
MFSSNVITPNIPDLFIVTDTTDFYHNGVHYFDEVQRSHIKDTSSTMFHNVVEFMNSDKARTLLSSELGSFFGDRLKGIIIQDPIDVAVDPKFILLSNFASNDSAPKSRTIQRKAALVQQYRKIKMAYGLLLDYERQNSIHYDLILRSRFDNMHGGCPLNVTSFNYVASDVFVPGFVDGLLVYDWCAFGTRQAMDIALSMYDQLGFTAANRLYRCECKNCGFLYCGERVDCACNGEMEYEEMTFSSEYHLYRLFKDNNVRYAASGHQMSPYRYR